MSNNSAADRWAVAQDAAACLLAEAGIGDYVVLWEDEEPGEETPEAVIHEARAMLRPRGLRLESDDRGLRVVALGED